MRLVFEGYTAFQLNAPLVPPILQERKKDGVRKQNDRFATTVIRPIKFAVAYGLRQ